jgi:ribosomal protein S27AE
MTYPVSQATVNCPNCGQAVTVRLEQVIDVGQDPAKKQQFLRGQVNVLACPRCGTRTVMASPLVYHDPEKQLLLAYVPTELNLPMAQEEQEVGRLTNLVLNNTPAEQRKAYLLNPTRIMSLNGLIEKVMEADGVNAEQLREQTQKVQLIVKMAEVAYDDAKLRALIEEHRAKIDYNFMMLITMTLQQAAQMHDEPTVDRYGRLRETIASQLDLKAEDMPSLGVEDNIDALIDDLLTAKESSTIALQNLVATNRPLIDYQFFLHLTQRADNSTDEEKSRLMALREELVQLTDEMDAMAQQAIETATQQLNEVLESPDIESKLQELYPHLNEAFLVVLSANVEQARAMNRDDIAELLMRIYRRVVELMEDRLRPEMKAMNHLLRTESGDERMAFLREQLHIYNPAGFIQMIDAVLDDLEQSGQGDPALMERLAQIGDEARIVAATLDVAPPVEKLFE